MTDFVSPLRPPEERTAAAPHHVDQMVAFPEALEVLHGPLAIQLTVSMTKVPRTKCSVCGQRRVSFRIGLRDVIQSPPVCGKCAGLR